MRGLTMAATAVLLALAGCGYPYTPPALAPVTTPAPPPRANAAAIRAPVTLLVSIDGFRPDYLGRGDTPMLDAVAAAGVSGSMRPSFPTLTFPNHYAIVTGLRPDRNGIVSNTMEDPRKPGVQFQISDAKVSHDRFWWDEAEPIWVTAERAGTLSATMFWPGSDAPIGGIRPSAWVPYDPAVTSRQRVQTVLDWMRRPPEERPRLVTLYFDVVDKTSHHDGFDSPAKTAAIREVDAAIGQLRDGLAAIGQPANLVIVSDHGMAPVPIANRLDPATVAEPATMRAIVEGPLLYVFAKSGVDPAVLARAVGRRAHFACWRRESLPARFRYGRNPRISPVVCLAETGWRFTSADPETYVRGDHGFDPADPAMRALFLAAGPAFAAGRRLPTFDNVDVYPLLRRLAGLPAAAGIDGDDRRFRDVMGR